MRVSRSHSSYWRADVLSPFTFELSPRMKLGPVLVDVGGMELTPDDIERLQHPQVGGVILFARNFAAPLQLIQLTHSIRELRTPALLIAVDHEGGREIGRAHV